MVVAYHFTHLVSDDYQSLAISFKHGVPLFDVACLFSIFILFTLKRSDAELQSLDMRGEFRPLALLDKVADVVGGHVIAHLPSMVG